MPVMEKYENPDLKRERATCPFDRVEITNLLDGGVELTEDRRKLGKKSKNLLSYSCILYFLNLNRGVHTLWFWAEGTNSRRVSQPCWQICICIEDSMQTCKKNWRLTCRTSRDSEVLSIISHSFVILNTTKKYSGTLLVSSEFQHCFFLN